MKTHLAERSPTINTTYFYRIKNKNKAKAWGLTKDELKLLVSPNYLEIIIEQGMGGGPHQGSPPIEH